MRILLEHTFPCTPDQYMEMIQSPDFDAMLERETGVVREVLESREENGVLTTRTKCIPDRELPAMIAKAIGSTKLVYDQHTRMDVPNRRIDWRIEPHKIGSKVDVAGKMSIVEHPEGCKRIVDGNVDVKVRFIGGQIEKAVVADVERNYHKSAGAIRAFIGVYFGDSPNS